ncbi:MAG: uroporphyrinogen-III C-methyltransferase [Terriglobales bacterium]
MKGKVYLVGAGPGDPDLLTLKALRLLKTADAVLHDDLVTAEILHLVPPTAQLRNVGKRSGTKKITQAEINFLMVTLAATGLQVVRLKSGDPLIFGRAGEEIEALRQAGIDYEIVPGITAALGAAAAAEIPLTHRRLSHAFVLLPGHLADDETGDWRKFVSSGATLALYMPGHDYSTIATRLADAGLDLETPCAIISRATAPDQEVQLTTVRKLASTAPLPSPALLLVGEVVRLARTAVSIESDLSRSEGQASFPLEGLQPLFLQAQGLAYDEE